jgi:hypothetical protein
VHVDQSWRSPSGHSRNEIFNQLLHRCEGVGQFFAIKMAMVTFAALIIKPNDT